MRIHLLAGLVLEDETHGAKGDEPEVSDHFGLRQIAMGRAIPAKPREIVNQDPPPQTRDPKPQNRDPRPAGKGR